MNVKPSTAYEAVIDTGETGLVGTIGMRVLDNLGATVTTFSAANVVEIADGIYAANTRTAPAVLGQNTIVWTRGSGGEVLGSEDLNVTFTAPDGSLTGDTYATVAELARILKVNAVTFADQLMNDLLAATGEINSEIAQDPDDLEAWQLALAEQVCIERAVEHWHARPVGFGIIGLDSETPVRLARDTWDRHAHKLAPLKAEWGIA